jgi:hypothetical protein
MVHLAREPRRLAADGGELRLRAPRLGVRAPRRRLRRLALLRLGFGRIVALEKRHQIC